MMWNRRMMMACLVALGATACGGGPAPESEIFVRVLSESRVVGLLQSVQLGIADSTGREIPNDGLSRSSLGGWAGSVPEVTTREALTVLAIGVNDRGEELATAEVAGFRLDPGHDAVVVLHLVAEPTAESEWNNPPVIEGLAVSPAVTEPDDVVTLTANVRDDDGDAIELEWEVATGSLTGETGPTPSWVAPVRPGAHAATLTVRDGSGAIESLAFRLENGTNPALDEGLGADFETSPRIEGLTTDPEAFGPGDTGRLRAEVYDRDGDEGLAYLWTASDDSCGGTLSDEETAAAAWEVPIELPAGTSCPFDILVSDDAIDDAGETSGRTVAASLQVELQCVHPVHFDVGNLGAIRIGHAATPPIDGKIYIIGEDHREDYLTYTTSIWEYDIESGESRELVDAWNGSGVGSLRRNSIALAANGKVYVEPAIGPDFNLGYGLRSCLFEFDPATGQVVETTACFDEAIWAVRLVAAGDGRVFAFGGWHDINETALGLPEEDGVRRRAIRVFDPSDDSFEVVVEEGEGEADGLGAVGMDGDSIQHALLGPDGLIYLFNSGRVATFDPETSTLEDRGEHGLLEINSVWFGDDGLLHGFCRPEDLDNWTGGFVLDPAALTVDSTPEVELFTYDEPAVRSYDHALSLDPEAGYLYVFGGVRVVEGPPEIVAAVERVSCLP